MAKELKRYMVKPDAESVSLKASWQDAVKSHTDILGALGDILKKFAAENPGQVEVSDFGIGTSVMVMTTPALAQKLSALDGVASVYDPIEGTAITTRKPGSTAPNHHF